MQPLDTDAQPTHSPSFLTTTTDAQPNRPPSFFTAAVDDPFRGVVYSQLLRRTPAASPSPVHGSSVPPPQPPLPFAPVVVSRLCLALAAVAVRAPNGIEVYVREAFALSQVCVCVCVSGGVCGLLKVSLVSPRASAFFFRFSLSSLPAWVQPVRTQSFLVVGVLFLVTWVSDYGKC